MISFSMIFVFVRIIDTHESAGKGGNLPEGDEECFVYLPLRVNIDPAEEHDESTNGEYGGGDELYVRVLFHTLFLKSGAKVV